MRGLLYSAIGPITLHSCPSRVCGVSCSIGACHATRCSLVVSDWPRIRLQRPLPTLVQSLTVQFFVCLGRMTSIKVWSILQLDLYFVQLLAPFAAW